MLKAVQVLSGYNGVHFPFCYSLGQLQSIRSFWAIISICKSVELVSKHRFIVTSSIPFGEIRIRLFYGLLFLSSTLNRSMLGSLTASTLTFVVIMTFCQVFVLFVSAAMKLILFHLRMVKESIIEALYQLRFLKFFALGCSFSVCLTILSSSIIESKTFKFTCFIQFAVEAL